MNKNIIKSLLTLAAAALVGAGCSVDDFNEKYLDGFDPDTSITDVQNIELTLTDADYSTIASNSTNRSIASAAGEAATAALSAIGTNKYFATTADAAAYIPAFLATKYSTLDDNSTALVTYTRALDIPEDVAAMNAMKSYTLTTADYQKVWGSESDYTEAITPATKGKLAGAISSEGLESGDYVAVTYNWSAAEPTFDKGEEPAPETPALTSVLGTAALNDVVTVTGYISALSSQGPILTDKGGSILIYGNSQTSHLALGEVVTVSGKIDHYNNGFQFGASSSTITQTGATVEVTYPEARVLTGADMDDMLTSRTDKDYYAEFVKVEATIAISGNYYNFNVEGATTAQGSFYGITDAIKAKVSDGQKVTLYGYLSSITKQSGAPKFVSIIVTHVDEEPATGGTPGEPSAPALTSVLGTAALNDVVTVTGYISALSSQGPILTDKGGSILIYGNSQTSHLALGEVVTVSGEISHYNNGFQFGASSATITQTGATVEVTYPEARVLTGADMDDMLTSRTDKDYYAEFVKVEATIAISGNYYNFNVEGATTAQGSFYGITDAIKAKVSDGQKVTLYGYLSSITKQSGAPKFVSIIVTHVNETPAAAAAAKAAYASAATRAVTMASEQRFAVYQWNGSAFADTDNAVVQPSDYRAMGQNYDNLTDPDQDTYLPQFLNANYPYGKDGDVKYVSYICRKNSANNWATDVYAYDGATWVKTNYFEARTDQFRVANKTWKIDPTLELDYSEMGTQEFKEFLQYCCNWVYDNIDVPLGAPARDNAGDILSTSSIKVNGANPAGSYYVSNYGNNEWYAGTYAYYGEMNWRADNARASYEAAGLGHLSDAEIVAQMQQNAAEVFQNVLHYMYPNVTTENYTKVIIKVYNYFDKPADGSVKGVYSYTFTVVGTGEFEYVPDSFTKL